MTETHESGEIIVLHDDAGGYYVLPRQTLEAARVTEESIPHLLALMSREQTADAGDTTGHGILLPQRAARLGGLSSTWSARGIHTSGGMTGLRQRGIILVSE